MASRISQMKIKNFTFCRKVQRAEWLICLCRITKVTFSLPAARPGAALNCSWNLIRFMVADKLDPLFKLHKLTCDWDVSTFSLGGSWDHRVWFKHSNYSWTHNHCWAQCHNNNWWAQYHSRTYHNTCWTQHHSRTYNHSRSNNCCWTHNNNSVSCSLFSWTSSFVLWELWRLDDHWTWQPNECISWTSKWTGIFCKYSHAIQVE